MRILTIALAIALVSCSSGNSSRKAASADVPTAPETFPQGRVETASIDSKILGAEVKYNVYLPAGYDISSRTFPIVYLLHGLTDTYTAWVEKGNMQEVADELIASGDACDMIIVMPNAGGPDVSKTWNGYFNMPGWAYEDFFFKEFMPAVEAKYHAIGDKGHRAVMGLSMGGGGSAVYAQHHPELFSSCYVMSGWLDNKDDEVNAGHKEKDCLYYVSKAVRENSAIDFVNNADDKTLEKLRSIGWFVDCGDDDFILNLSLSFYQAMRSRKVPCELRVRDGVHNWNYWHVALAMALPFATEHFGK